MTVKRLEELKKIFEEGQGTIQDIGEIMTEFFQSFSAHSKHLKGQLSEIQSNQEILYAEIEQIKTHLNPVYTWIENEDEDEDNG